MDAQHYAEVELTPAGQPVRGWRVVCGCGWTGLWRDTLADAVGEFDEHLAEYGIFVFDGAWWVRLPHLTPVEEVAPDREAMANACSIWAAEAVHELDRLCDWVRPSGNEKAA